MLAKRLFCLLAILTPVFGWGQPADRFQALLHTAPTEQPALATSKMNKFIEDLKARQVKIKSDETFLRYAFREAHKTFFHTYKAYSQFPEIFDSGNYDCLSATSFLTVVLDAFGFKYDIIETNYHIFLVVDTEGKKILLETTDMSNGFISDAKMINERINQYRENTMQAASDSDKFYYQYNLDLYQTVMPHQLNGLLYFNQAVEAFNQNDLEVCALNLKKAIRIYNSPRIAEFVVILVSQVALSDMNEEDKKNLIRPFASWIKTKTPVVAAR